ncbi:isopenicillin N synthase family oxygenase [Frankia sp. CNm7]|uniref:Isopenicillin N synthase family oxygenase n=1 Tax=Frankia nepalensis TaxID=1836974 RepID=A0A937RL12_9ACTN|nr:isopenicillin N synthase family oxygenase [Frankia nepalensis]MBL7509747.1 isopenicillin N synthase family oxygenase [Frankia nepalensis]MBL7518772.1 isopenicillin N synthase family oxygenase [Frankia nepalensis]MBL7627866.1 isopenicillin N synthase family oxygenase [Frankia nepalensis]
MIDVSDIERGNAAALADVAARVDAACTATGFFVAVGHGVDRSLTAAALAAANDLFRSDGVTKDGLRLQCPPGVQRGYYGLGAEAQALAAAPPTNPASGSGPADPATAAGRAAPADPAADRPDLSETFAIGPEPPVDAGPFTAGNVWPPHLPGFQRTWIAYRRAMEAFAHRLLQVAALALRDDPRAFDALVTRPIGTTRANHYPALAAPPEAGQRRGGAHTDYGTLTVLAVDGHPGLEVRVGEAWVPVTCPPDGLVVNVGDLLAVLSGARWRSAWHRVAVPPGRPPYPARTSIAHFQFPNHDAVIDGVDPAGRPVSITAGAYLTTKLAQLGRVAPRATTVRHRNEVTA